MNALSSLAKREPILAQTALVQQGPTFSASICRTSPGQTNDNRLAPAYWRHERNNFKKFSKKQLFDVVHSVKFIFLVGCDDVEMGKKESPISQLKASIVGRIHCILGWIQSMLKEMPKERKKKKADTAPSPAEGPQSREGYGHQEALVAAKRFQKKYPTRPVSDSTQLIREDRERE